MRKIVLGAIAIAAGLAAQTEPGAAYGHAPWCSSVNQGGGNVVMFCYYPSAQACALDVVSGNRGGCMLNPEYVDNPPRRARFRRY